MKHHTVHCSICGKAGHNRTRHDKRRKNYGRHR